MRNTILTTAAAIAMAAMSANAQNLCMNGSLENAIGPFPFQFWENYNNVFAETDTPQDGARYAKMYGQFGGIQSDQVMLQYVPADEGTTYTLSSYVRHNSGDEVEAGPGQNAVILQMSFLDVNGSGLGAFETTVIDPNTPTDVWAQHSVSAVSPAGTTEVLIALLHIQIDGAALGASLWDNVELVAGDAPCNNPADLNGDGELDFLDISAFLSAYSMPCPE